MNIGDIEEIVDKDFESMELWKWQRDFALMAVCTEYERGVHHLHRSLTQAKTFAEKNLLLIQLNMFFDILDWLIIQRSTLVF
ncbi:hypothetical protein [Domibacillus epiphyticus]|uniref:Uncharacterized protein n=1 Tax=Domibacillus epiphyticus TaxID=1714355 RepID=A0A1V2ACJ7_9BACI|nr:hypothetical protein [Domibacillus epiphyticus]OMP68687.1 hypothetical protein BTO28_01155 [Domibacillus epiphyticus]